MQARKENLLLHVDPTHPPTNMLIFRKVERKLLHLYVLEQAFVYVCGPPKLNPSFFTRK